MSSFVWDGSYLGCIETKNLIKHSSIKMGRPLRLCTLSLNNESCYCLVKMVSSYLPSIIDEFKPLFSLTKIGTHLFRYRSKMMIAYRPCFDFEGAIIIEATLDLLSHQAKQEQVIADQVRLILAFREIFGLTDTFEKSIIVRDAESPTPLLISFLEPGSVLNTNDKMSSVIRPSLFDSWFSCSETEKSLEQAIVSLFCLNRDSPETSIVYYRKSMSEIIHRINPDYIGYLDLFIDRLNLYLPY